MINILVIKPLIFINRLNLLILKRYLRGSVKKKIRWSNSDSIQNSMLYTSYQINEKLIENPSPINIFIYLYLLISIIISYPFLYILSIYPYNNCRKKRVKSVDIVYKKYIKTDITDEEIEQLKLYNTSIIECIDKDFEKLNIIEDSYNPLYTTKMSFHGKRSLYEDNAGGKSDISEAWSIHHISNYLKSNNCLCEMEVNYLFKYKMVDYILSNKDENIGVSVVRALCYKNISFTFEDGVRLLNKKINGLVISRRSISKDQTFYKSILHIWSPNLQTTDILKECISSDEFNFKEMYISGIMTIWITTSNYSPIFNNGNNLPYKT